MSDLHRLAFWTNALNLPGFRVVHEHRDTPSDPVRFTVVPLEQVAVCPQCGHACDTVHRRHDSAPIKDLPSSEQAVELIVRTPQFECEHCQKLYHPDSSGHRSWRSCHPTLPRSRRSPHRLLRHRQCRCPVSTLREHVDPLVLRLRRTPTAEAGPCCLQASREFGDR